MTTHFIVNTGLHSQNDGPWEYQVTIRVAWDGAEIPITEWAVKATPKKEKPIGAKVFGDFFVENFAIEEVIAERKINDLLHLSDVQTYKGISVGDIIEPIARVDDWGRYHDLQVTGFIFTENNVVVRFKGHRGNSDVHYIGEYFERVRLNKKGV